MWHRHAGLLEFHCVVSTFIWSHLLPLNLFKRLNVSGNETGLSGQITTSKEYHSSPTIEQKKDVYRALFAQFYRLSGIFAHPVGTGSTSNNSRSWIPFLMGSLRIQSEQGPTSNNFRSWTQVLLASLATNSQLFVDTLVTLHRDCQIWCGAFGGASSWVDRVSQICKYFEQILVLFVTVCRCETMVYVYIYSFVRNCVWMKRSHPNPKPE